jgi:hypothetical protein
MRESGDLFDGIDAIDHPLAPASGAGAELQFDHRDDVTQLAAGLDQHLGEIEDLFGGFRSLPGHR